MENSLSKGSFNDWFKVDDNLKYWASLRIISRGKKYYQDGNVVSLEILDDNKISAEVIGNAPEPYKVEISWDRQNMPVVTCNCPFTWEPVCKHAVAVLLAYQQEITGSEPRLGSYVPASSRQAGCRPDSSLMDTSCQDESVEMESFNRTEYLSELTELGKNERRIRSQEQDLKIVNYPSTPFGCYNVTSGNPDRKARHYSVKVRDKEHKHTTCNCMDFLTNELDTCKHIELVRKKSRRKYSKKKWKLAENKNKTVSLYHYPMKTLDKLHNSFSEIRVCVPSRLYSYFPLTISNYLDDAGHLKLNGHNTNNPEKHYKGMIKLLQDSANGKYKVKIEPEVASILDNRNKDRYWTRKIQPLLKLKEQHPVWKKAVGGSSLVLHKYQIEGVLFALQKRRAFIGDDMGLGKTIQAISLALILKHLKMINRVLVICPTSLKSQWKREIEKVSKEPILIVQGNARQREELYKSKKPFFFIINYETIYRDLEEIRSLSPDLIILDEGQRIKNWETKLAKRIKELESEFALVLTGTPLQNRLSELHSLSEFLHPRILGPAWRMMPTYADLDVNDRIVGYSNLDMLRERTGQYLIRRDRSEVLTQLPERTDNNYWVGLSPKQVDVHNEYGMKLSRLLNKFKKFKRLTREDIQRMLMYLTCMRIICNAYGQYYWEEFEMEVLTSPVLSKGTMQRISSSKFEEFRNVISELLEDTGRMEQRIGRVHRMGQKKNVQVINFICEEGVEARIYGLVNNKKALFDGVFNADIKSVRFNKQQQKNFVEKVKEIMSQDSGLNDDKEVDSDLEDIQLSSVEAQNQRIDEKAENSVSDNVVETKERDNRSAMEIDLKPVIDKISSTPASEDCKVFVQQDSTGSLVLKIPNSARNVLQGFRSLLDTILTQKS